VHGFALWPVAKFLEDSLDPVPVLKHLPRLLRHVLGVSDTTLGGRFGDFAPETAFSDLFVLTE
jgi:hypothetical protein